MGTIFLKGKAPTQPAAQNAFNWMTSQTAGSQTQTARQPATTSNQVDGKIFSMTLSSTPVHTPAHNTAAHANYQARQPITSTKTEYFPPYPSPKNPTVSAIFGAHRGDQSALFSPLGKLPDQENNIRDRGVI